MPIYKEFNRSEIRLRNGYLLTLLAILVFSALVINFSTDYSELIFLTGFISLFLSGFFLLIRPAAKGLARNISAIREMQGRLSGILTATGIGTWECNFVTGEVMLGKDWIGLLGYERNEINVNSLDQIYDRIHPEDIESLRNAMASGLNPESPYFEIEVRMKHKSAEWIWIQFRGRLFNQQDGRESGLFYGTYQDVTDRRQKEELVKISEQTFRGVFENASIGMALVSENGSWIRVNGQVCELLGYSEEELLKTDFQSVTFPDDLESDLELLTQLAEGKRDSYKIEKRYIHRSGRLVYALLGVSVVRDSYGKILHFISQIIDITESRLLEKEREYNEALLDALYKLSPIGIALNDFETGAFIDVNNRLIEPTGYTKEEFLKLSYWDITPKDYASQEELALISLKETGQYGPYEKEYLHKSGVRYPVMLRGLLVKDLNGKDKIWSFVEDMTEIKATQRELHETLMQLQAIFDGSTQVSIISTDINGLITAFNSGAEHLLGYSAGEVVGKASPVLFHDEYEMQQAARKIFDETGIWVDGIEVFVNKVRTQPAETKEWTYRRKDGVTFPVLVSVSALRDRGEIIGFLGVATDISGLKSAEQKVIDLLRTTQDQNERLRNFAHIVSHNLRSHSGGISSIIRFMEEDMPSLKEEELFGLLNQASENLTETIKHLTDVIEINLYTKENYSTVGLHRAIENNIASLMALARDLRVEIRNEVDPEFTIEAVPAYIDSIILNFVSNAIKYKSNDKEAYVAIRAYPENSYLILEFEDNGLGIDLTMQGKKIFGMYKTFHKHKDSRGIGLFITKNQIEAMNGKVEVYSEVNKGSIFKVFLPYEEN